MVRVYGDEEEVTTDEALPSYKDQVRPHSRDATPPSTNPSRAEIPMVATKAVTDSMANSMRFQGLPLAQAVALMSPHEEESSVPSFPNPPQQQNHSAALTAETATDSQKIVEKKERPKVSHDDDMIGCHVSRAKVLWMLGTLLLLGGVIGGFCGTGKCGSSSSSSSSNSTSNATTPTTAPPNDVQTMEAYLRSISLLSDSERMDPRLREAEDLSIEFLAEDTEFANGPLLPVKQFHLRQQFALLNLYYGTRNDTTAWTNNTGWLSQSNNECEWYGVVCMEHDFTESTRRLAGGNTTAHVDGDFSALGVEWVVQSLVLYDNDLHGRLSPNVCLLDFLAYFDVANNQISGYLPSGMQYCSNLIEFSVSDNTLTGSIPSELGMTWTNLNKFAIWNNPYMAGTLPESLGQWSNIYTFDVGTTGVYGSFPESMATQWTNIGYFYANTNAMTGTIPESMGSTWTNLEVFDIGSNQFNGTLPTTIGLWTKLREFSVESNSFTGPIPESIVNWVNLDAAFLQNNEFTGTIPEDVCTTLSFTSFVTQVSCSCCMNTTLEPTPSPPFVMDMEMYIQSVAESAGSSTSQTMDAELEAIDWLINNNEVLQLYPFDAYGQFRLRQRYALLTLYFATQSLADPWISDEGWLDEPSECLWKGVTCTEFEPEPGLGNQFVVEGIFLAENGLHGKLSPDLSLLKFMKYFDVHGNRISGTLPPEFGECGSLLEFKIENNTLTGTLPPEYGTVWTNLYSFSAWDNDLSGSLPESYGNMTSLSSIDLDNNNITGSFPSAICNWHNMEYFYFAENSLTGPIPDSFANSTPLMKHFAVNDNDLTGTISPWYGSSYTNIEIFTMANNMFAGMIPESLYDWPLATTIDFSGNALTGMMPSTFCDLLNVTYLAADAANVSCDCCDCCGY